MTHQPIHAPAMKQRGWGLLIGLSMLWGGSFFFSEVALQALQPFTVVFCRVTIAAIALLACVYLSGHTMPFSPRLWRSFLIMGVLNNFIPFSLIVWGQTQVSSGLASILNATTPLFSVILAHLLMPNERLTSSRFIGVLLGIGGVSVMIGPEVLHGLTHQGLGQVAVLGAALSYSMAGIYGQQRFRSLSPVVTAAGMVTGSSIVMMPLVLMLQPPWTITATPTIWGAVLALGLFSTAIAYLLYFHILAIAGATNLLLVTFLIPISALLLGTMLLHEQLTWNAIVGMVLIFVGLLAIDGRLLSSMCQSFIKEKTHR